MNKEIKKENNVVLNFIRMFIFIMLVGSLGGCTDAEWQKFSSLGNGHSIKCYSGGVVIYEGSSTGKVLSEDSSDGYYFEEKGSGKLMEVSGNCVITRLE